MTSTAGPILLNVDDTEAARYAKSRTLRHAGFEVIEAGTGAAALELVEHDRPALVLLDVRLPDMSGSEVCRLIKQRWPATMVLQTSATFVSARDRTRGLDAGADTYLVQPVDPDELVAAVRALLRLHAAEAAARVAKESLEQRIAERTRTLHETNVQLLQQIAQRERAEAALVQAQKMEAVGQLTGAIAHDFNNLLAAFTGYLHLARRKTAETETAGLIGKALSVAERGSKLTARLLAFSRTQSIQVEAVDIDALLTSMTDWLVQSAGPGIHVEVAHGSTLAAWTDANQLELAILNLLINSRDAMPEGGRIRIEAHESQAPEGDEQLAPGRYVVVSVCDDGKGMSPEVAARAFDPFYSTKPVGRGTGLGLAQVYGLSRQSNGSARIDSGEGRGTTVSIWLPAAELAASEPMTTAAGAFAGGGERILLVDDDDDVRQTVSALLADSGYAVSVAASGTLAIEALRTVRPDLLIVDFAMPEIDGAEVAALARSLHAELPVIFLSGHADTQVLEAAAAGARLLRKPFRPSELLGAVSRALAG